jgi:hypothetical protein
MTNRGEVQSPVTRDSALRMDGNVAKDEAVIGNWAKYATVLTLPLARTSRAGSAWHAAAERKSEDLHSVRTAIPLLDLFEPEMNGSRSHEWKLCTDEPRTSQASQHHLKRYRGLGGPMLPRQK